MTRIGVGVLVSGSGSNFEALVAATRDGRVPEAEVRVVISNKPGAGALERARRLGVEAAVLEPKDFSDAAAYFSRLADELEKRGAQVVCLAGFLLRVEPVLLKRFPGRVLNIHPALLPKYGGKGMWGRRVHEAVLASGDRESGCSVHVVDEEYDHGPVVLQTRVPVSSGDTPETLAARVLEQEHRLYPEALRKWVQRILAESGKETK